MHKTRKLIRHQRTLGHEQAYRRDGEEERDAESLVIFEELRKVELRHPVDRTPCDGRVDKVALAAGDVGGGEVGECAVFEGVGWVLTLAVSEVFADLELGNEAFGDEVLVGDIDAYIVNDGYER